MNQTLLVPCRCILSTHPSALLVQWMKHIKYSPIGSFPSSWCMFSIHTNWSNWNQINSGNQAVAKMLPYVRWDNWRKITTCLNKQASHQLLKRALQSSWMEVTLMKISNYLRTCSTFDQEKNTKRMTTILSSLLSRWHRYICMVPGSNTHNKNKK